MIDSIFISPYGLKITPNKNKPEKENRIGQEENECTGNRNWTDGKFTM